MELNNKSMMVVNRSGLIRVLYVPIYIVCIRPIGDFRINHHLYIEAIEEAPDGGLFYIIFQTPYPHSYFSVELKF